MKDFVALTRGTNEGFGVDPVVANTQRLSQRVDELEDLVVELKQKQSASDIVEIRQVVSQLHLDNASMIDKIKLLSESRVNSKDLFGTNDMHQSYLSIMREREKVIEKLYHQVKRLTQQQTMMSAKDAVTSEQAAVSSQANAGGPFADLMKMNEKLQAEANEAAKRDFREERLKDAVNFRNLMETQTEQQKMYKSRQMPAAESAYTGEVKNLMGGVSDDKDAWLIRDDKI